MVQVPGLTCTVEKIFVDSWNTYREFAFGHDELLPASEASRMIWAAGERCLWMQWRVFHLFFSHVKPNIHPILLEKAKESNIAEAGSLTLEWTTLSKFTNNATYGDLALKAVEHIENLLALYSPTRFAPGLAARLIDPVSGEFDGAYISWGGGSDSYFEYLLQYARLSNTANNIFIETWKTAVDSSIKFLLRTSTVGDHFYLADDDDEGQILHVGSHLACFFPGNWLLGGKLLKNQTIIDLALKLNDGCWNTYASTQTGVGPEAFAWINSDNNATGGGPTTPAQQAFYNKNGFYITGSDCMQCPEVLEYLDRAAAAIASFNNFLPATRTVAFAGLSDVNNCSAGLIDITESFCYLTFDDPAHISLDDYVFNTECHPLRAPPALNSYC
ncbi:glycoside hydrolase [Mycena epipterygia]|nr:glycoside hydrolase [Mycena epipterygia]